MMVSKINIKNQELLVLLEFDDSEYEKITMCLDEQDKKVFVINTFFYLLYKHLYIY